jgi:hypothetical protein
MSFNLSSAPFSSTSDWNQQVPTGATYTSLNWPTSTGYNYGATWANTGFPVYVASSSDPVVQVSVPASWGWPGGTVSVHVPAGATGAANGTDAPIIVIDGDTVYNFWRFNRTSDTTATAQSYGEANVVTGTGWGALQTPTAANNWQSSVGAGVGAAGNSELGGLLVQAQTDTGTIDHALQLAVDGSLLKPGYVAPAIATDGSSSSGMVQEGQLLAIPPGAPMPSGLSPLGQEVFRALQQYGAYVTEMGGTQTVLRAQQNAYNATTINALDTDLNKVLPLLEAVSGGSPTSSGSTSSSGTTSGGTTVTHAPTVAITSAGQTVTSASQTIAGTVDAADAGSTVKVLDGTTQIGSATVGANGAWSTNVTLSNQGANVITATDANTAGTGTSGAVTYTLHSVAPTVAITSAGGTVTSASQTIAGTVDAVDAGSTVKVRGGTTQIGSATVGANGAWSANVTLPNQGANVITATDANAAGTGTSSAVTYTLSPIAQQVTAAPTVAITSAGGTVTSASQTIAGTVDAADASSTVKVFDGTTQIGSTTVGANGAWSANVTLPNQGANVLTATDANAAGTGTSGAVTYDYEPPAPPTTPLALGLTVANQSPYVSPGGGILLGLGVSVPNASDNVSVTISGLPRYETITASDGATSSGSSGTFTATEVNSGLSLSSSYHGHGRPTATLTVTATDTTTGVTSAAQTIRVVDPPATTTSSGTSTTTTGSGTSTTTSGSGTSSGHHWAGHHHHHHNAVTASSSGTSTTTSGSSSGQSGTSQNNVAQWFSDHPDFARAATTLSDAGASKWGAAQNGATTSTDATGSAGARAYALLNQMMAGDFGGHSQFASTATASTASSQQQANLLATPLH